jgi:hypothetical protein
VRERVRMRVRPSEGRMGELEAERRDASPESPDWAPTNN